MLKPDWTDDQPIYRQLKNKVTDAILRGVLKEGEALPSVRTVAVDLRINPITASKAYQELCAEGLVEKRRGLGMFVKEGARARLLEEERRCFLEMEWPKIVERIALLGLDVETLLRKASELAGRGRDANESQGEMES